MEDDDSIVDYQSECACCAAPEVVEPSITRLTCGAALAKTSFDVSVRDDIPDEAEDMTWLRRVVFQRDGTHAERKYCVGTSGQTFSETNQSETGAYLWEVYDPEDDCAMAQEAGGTGATDYTFMPDACDDPPDLTVTSSSDKTYTLRTDAGSTLYGIWDWTGTVDGSPASGSIVGLPLVNGYPGPAGGGTRVFSAAVTSGPVAVLQTVNDSCVALADGTGGVHDVDYDIVFGYAVPDDYRLEFDFSAGTERFYQLRAPLYFTPAGGSESLVEVLEVDWVQGDDPVVLSWEFAEIGSFRLSTVLVRAGKTGVFTEFEITP